MYNKINEEQYMRFPAVLKKKLIDKEIELPPETEFNYDKIYTYRAVERTKDDKREITLSDFKSYYEQGKTPKTPRGMKNDWSKDPHLYGVSCFLKKEIVEQKMRFPNPKKKMASGYVYQEGGPQETNLSTQHVCWWLYEDVDVSGFVLMED